MRHKIQSQRNRNQAGFTLVELMIAGVLLVFGVMTMAGLVGLTVKNNGHSRLDSTATMLNQAVVEQVASGIGYQSAAIICSTSTDPLCGIAKITDCGTHTTLSTAWLVNSVIGGANTVNGNIDFTQAKTSLSGYQMDYVVCNGAIQTTYDVRWSISALVPSASATTTTSFTHILTVGTQMEGGSSGIINFPINMRMMVGPDPVPGS
jgi:Tfp pilus assembly protein PilV